MQTENTLIHTYELTDHLGNVRAVVQKKSNTADITNATDYYPFGWRMPDRVSIGGNRYRFGYQGQFSEYDPKTGYNQFEARLLDTRIGRWLTTDPAGQFFSPYVSMGNNPINGVDPDGRLFIFVNGWESTKYISRYYFTYNLLSSINRNNRFGLDKSGYWGGIVGLYKQNYGFKNENVLYVNASYNPLRSAKARYRGGVKWGKNLIRRLDKGVIILKSGETLKIIGHSMGGAYATGIATAVANSKYADRVELVDLIAYHGTGKQIPVPESLYVRQFATSTDLVSAKFAKKIKLPNVDEFILRSFHPGLFGGHFLSTWHGYFSNFFKPTKTPSVEFGSPTFEYGEE